MKRIFAVLLLVALAACDHVRPVAPPAPPGSISPQSVQSPSGAPVAGSPRALIGDQAVADLRRWYDDTRSDCGGATSPAFVCSGVMLRATGNSANYLPWNPNPNSTGVSFSWIRKDTNFSKLVYGYGNGFIFYPKSENTAGSQVIDVECAFPHDGGTNDRPSLSGCGQTPQYPQSSRPCDDQGIQTYSSWLQSFNGLVNKHLGQCGWSMRSSARANRFTQFILARQGMAVANWSTQNELRMVKWAQNSVVPIRAFFYIPSEANALTYAKEDQRRYKSTFNKFAPIIRLTLSASKTASASFAYNKSDQVVDDPGDSGGDDGSAALADIRRWYGDDAANCNGKPNEPVALCGGLLLRTLPATSSASPWEPSTDELSSGGISLSYLRTDVNFTGLPAQNGLILYPSLNRPAKTRNIALLCMFPVEADSIHRTTAKGCGPNTLYPKPSLTRPCNVQGISTLPAWQALYASMTDKTKGQCGWNVRPAQADNAARFVLAIQAHEVLPDSQWRLPTELRVVVWPAGTGVKVPVRAFFFVPEAAGALAAAQKDQLGYRQAYGIVIPIVRLKLPAKAGKQATFNYVRSDQVTTP